MKRFLGTLLVIIGGLGLFFAAGSVTMRCSSPKEGLGKALLVWAIFCLFPLGLLLCGCKLRKRKSITPQAPPTLEPPATPSAISPPVTAVSSAVSSSELSPIGSNLNPSGVFPSRKPKTPYTPTYDAESQCMIDSLLSLNNAELPFRIVDGRAEGVDLVAEWKIVDAEFYTLFAKAGVRRVFRMYMKLDPKKQTVRSKDQDYEVNWTHGVPSFKKSASYFQGQKFTMEKHVQVGIKKDTLRPGVVVNYTFKTSEIKNPVKEAIKSAGWKYKGVAFAKL